MSIKRVGVEEISTVELFTVGLNHKYRVLDALKDLDLIEVADVPSGKISLSLNKHCGCHSINGYGLVEICILGQIRGKYFHLTLFLSNLEYYVGNPQLILFCFIENVESIIIF